MKKNDDRHVIISLCMHCRKVYGCKVTGLSGQKDKTCRQCEEKRVCAWRHFNVSQVGKQEISISHGYCSNICILVNGDNVENFTTDEIINMLTTQSGFHGNPALLRQQMKTVEHNVQSKLISEENGLRKKKDIILRMLL